MAGLIVLLPFLWAGALGGVTETVLAVLAAIAVGGLASSTLDTVFFGSFEPGQARRIWLGGLAAGVALTLIGAGAGGNGVQVLMLLVLPPLGFAAAALRSTGPLVGIAAFGPLAFVDPVEVNLFLLDRDVPFWAATASAVAWLVGLIIGLGYGLASRPLEAARRPLAIGTAAVVALGAGAVYAVGGQPGFYGDQLFVVMKEQASLDRAAHHDRPRARPRPAGGRRLPAAWSSTPTAPRLRCAPSWTGGSLSYQPYYLVNAILVNAGPEVRAWLELRDDVDRVLIDQRLRPLPQPVGQTVGAIKAATHCAAVEPEHGRRSGRVAAWRQGQGIVVGSSDSGVDGSHPALASGYRGGDDSWFDPWNHTTFPVDHGGHGTHTLGTAVGREQIGVAPQSQWVAA